MSYTDIKASLAFTPCDAGARIIWRTPANRTIRCIGQQNNRTFALKRPYLDRRGSKFRGIRDKRLQVCELAASAALQTLLKGRVS